MSMLVGKQLGKYRLTRHLGSGGFADVYLGEHWYLDVPHAVKVLNTQVTGNEMQKFLAEARTLARLEHPHIIPVHDFGVEANTAYLAMAYAPHGTLQQYLHVQSQPSLLVILSIVKQIAEALQYVHDKGHTHCDIKPDNILLGPDNKIWLSDFGIAIASQNTKKQEVVGTVQYMAPEQIRGLPCPASDQYALAIVIYEWLTGSCPFDGQDSKLIALQHLQALPPSLHTQVPTISLDVEKVVLRALEKEAGNRFSSVKEFAWEFEQACLLNGNGIQGGSQPVIGQLSKLPTTKVLPRIVPPTRRVKQPLGTCLYTYTGHTDFVHALAWSPDGMRIASASDDRTVKIWDALTGNHPFVYRDHRSQVWTVAWSRDGQYIASGSGRQVAQVWKPAQGTCLVTYDRHSPAAGRYMVAWSPDNKYVASAGRDGTVQVWQTTSGLLQFTFHGHSAPVNAVAWSPDGQRIVSASDDKTVQVWQAASGNHLLTHRGHSNEVLTVAWSPDGKYIASAGRDRTVQVWDSSTGDRLFTYEKHERRILAISWSPEPNSTRIASVDDDRIVQVWDAFTGKQLFLCEGEEHTKTVNALAWSPDGQLIASASNDKTVRIWQA